MAKTGDILVGLDIGTTKICAIVGEVTDEGIDIIGIGSHPSKGLRKGVVVNIDATVASIKRAIEEAEHMAGCEITTVYTGIAGGHIKAFPSHGVVAVKDKEVRQQDVDRVIDQAKAVAIPLDREVIHVLPQEFVVDDQDGVKDPVGMSGVRLEAKALIVTG
ncbi:MAG TPA: cell division protein FtsA, partial [Anaeromyxobacteraceae bacterium]|nr:cell division protein FtsA [Anaeromyxobacteraceae bacterium]